jgi:hypothetical protein
MLQIISLFNYLFMAKQAGDYFIEGTFDDLTFYKMCGDYYVRMKSSLTGKRFWKEKAFEGSRKSCSRFGDGNTLASSVFQLVREERRTNRLFPFLRTRAIALLKEEKSAEEVVCLLLDYLVDFGFTEIEGKQKRDGFVKRQGNIKKRYPVSSICFLALPTAPLFCFGRRTLFAPKTNAARAGPGRAYTAARQFLAVCE